MSRATTKTAKGIALFDAHPDWSPYKCAMEAKISPSAIYKALRLREAALDGTCPTCGQRITKESAT